MKDLKDIKPQITRQSCFNLSQYTAFELKDLKDL